MDQRNILKHHTNLLIIGGSGRNVGKTTLALSLIRKISETTPVLGLKVSTFKSGEDQFHGNHLDAINDGYRITRETRKLAHKDTALMLDAGAVESYFIEVSENKVSEAFNEFTLKYNSRGLPIVCESRALRLHVRPGLFILLVNENDTKQGTSPYLEMADIIYYFDNDLSKLIDLANKLSLGNEGWKIS